MASSSSGQAEGGRSRDEMVASFQDITGILDVDRCSRILENCHWNLEEAIETALAAGADWHSSDIGGSVTVDMDEDVEVVTAREADPANSRQETENPFRALLTQHTGEDVLSRQPPYELDDYSELPRRRMLNFNVSYRGKQYAFALPDDETIRDLKNYIARDIASVTGPLQPADMELRGWRAAGERDETPLYSLHLPKENIIELLTPKLPDSSTGTTSNGSASKASGSDRKYRLDVYDKDNDRTHQLTCDGNRSIGDVKRDVFALNSLPPSRQMWTGWPPVNGKLEDCMRLAELSLDTPVHRLKVERAAVAAKANDAETVSSDEDESMDVSVHRDDAEDSIIIDDNHLSPAPAIDRQHQVPLIPADYSSPQEAIENFLRVYESRYGENHPLFYPGSLEDAIRDSCQVKASRRKPLIIYLHDDASVAANVFCTQVLSAQAVTDFLNQNFAVWAWDCTLQENKNKLLLLLSNQLGSTLAYELKKLERDRFPVLLFVHKARGALEVVHIVKAPCSLDELMAELMQAVDGFSRQNRLDVIDEEEREARERMRSEQEQAYQDSLNADRIKAEQKRIEQEKLLAEKRMKEEEAVKLEEERKMLSEQLPPEPPSGAGSTTIRLRLPTADIIERRFLVTEKLSTLLKFAASKGYKSDSYRLLTSYPKVDLTTLDNSKSLEELKLCPRETVVVEEK